MEARDPFGWIGTTIDGSFSIEALAGEGSFGIVYRGRHLGFDEPVAIKCLKIPTELDTEKRASFLATFHEEARLLLRLSRRTAGIVQALDVGAAICPKGAWTPYIVMEWLEGESLEDDLLRRQKTGAAARSLPGAIDLLTPAATAIGIAHEEGVSHRDIKPGNLFLAKVGAATTVKVVDFGIAKVMQDTPSLTEALARTGTGLKAFTPAYGAPEQFSARYGATGPWTDVFALALVLMEVASGKPGLEGKDPMQLFVSACDREVRPTFRGAGILASAAMEEVLRRALEVEPAKRFHSAGELWRALEEARGSLSTAATALAPMGPESAIVPAPPRLPDVRIIEPSAPSSPASAGGPAAAAEENRVCTIMFADLSGFTALSERLDPEQVKDIIDHCFHAFTECIEKMGGWVDKFIGDCVMAIFGVPKATDNDAERAIHAALQMQAALTTIVASHRALRRNPLSMRIGINTGRVFAGKVGGATRKDFTVIGDAVNVAARLQQHGPQGAVIIGRDTYRHVVGVFDVEPLAPIEAKGKAERLAAYRVIGPASAVHAIPPTDFYGFATKLVGRNAEMQRLLDLLETTMSEPRAALVTLVGPPGAGRSRILAELAANLASRPEFFLVMMANGAPLRADVGYGVAASLFRARFHIHEDDPVEVVERKLRRGVRWFAAAANPEAPGTVAPPWELDEPGDSVRPPAPDPPRTLGAAEAPPSMLVREAASEIATLLGSRRKEGTGADSLAPDEAWSQAKNRVSAAVARLLGAVASRSPVVILCDDIQWADDASLDLLDDVVVRLAEMPILVVCSARSVLYERRAHWGEGKPGHVRIDMAPLARRQVEEMARDRLRSVRDLSPDFVRLLADRAEGNPLTLEETLHLLVDAGVIDRSVADAWVVRGERLHELALPATIQGIVQARLDRLDPEARSVLAQAAVIGRTFWAGAVDHLRVAPDLVASVGGQSSMPPRARSTGDVLGALRERQLLRAREASTFPGEYEYVFAEAALHEVAYDTLSGKTRRRLHRLVAEWLAARAPGDGGAAMIAMHHDRGGDPRRAVVEYTRAASHAASLGQNAEALRHLERARDLHDESETTAVGDESGPGRTSWLSDPDDVRVASWQDRTRLRLDLGDVLRRVGRLEDAERTYDEARTRILRVERRTGGTLDFKEALRWEARVDYRLALSHKVRGATETARTLAERAITLATDGGVIEETATMWALVAQLHRRERNLDAYKEAALRGIRVLRATSNRDERWRESVSRLLTTLGGVFYFRRQMVRAERCYRQAARVVDEKMHPEAASLALNDVAVLRAARGDFEGARIMFQRAHALKERLGDLRAIAVSHSNLAEVELRLGRPTQAVEHAMKGARLGEQVQAEDLPEILRVLAEASLALDRSAEALEAIERALGLATVGGGRVYFAEVALTMARICKSVATSTGGDPEVAARARAVATRLAALLSAGLGVDLGARGDECRAILADVVPAPT